MIFCCVEAYFGKETNDYGSNPSQQTYGGARGPKVRNVEIAGVTLMWNIKLRSQRGAWLIVVCSSTVILWGNASNCWQIGHSCESCSGWCSSHKRCMYRNACVANIAKNNVAVTTAVVLNFLLIINTFRHIRGTGLPAEPADAEVWTGISYIKYLATQPNLAIPQ